MKGPEAMEVSDLVHQAPHHCLETNLFFHRVRSATPAEGGRTGEVGWGIRGGERKGGGSWSHCVREVAAWQSRLGVPIVGARKPRKN